MNDTSTNPATSTEWAAYHLASAIRHLGDAVREGLEAIAKAMREQRQTPAPK